MNNFNPNGGTGNGSSNHSRSPSMSSSARSRSMFGFHQFNSNETAHSFVNTALNSGSGYRGGIATAFEIPDPSTFQSPRPSIVGYNGLPISHNSSVIPSPLRGFFSAMNPIGLHPHPIQNRVPPPSDSVMLVLASVDEPTASSGQRLQSQQQNGNGLLGGLNGNSQPPLSPFPSNASQASSGSHCSHSSSCSHHSSSSSNHSSDPGLRCPCDDCRRCVCHMYCSHHAEIRCPVHGLGRGSSGESNSSSSPGSGAGNRSSGSPHMRFHSNVNQSNSWNSFDSEFGGSPVHSDSCQCVTCQFCICNVGGMFTNCIARCAKHGMVRL